MHRDPVKVLLSVARLTEVLRAPFTRGSTRGDRPAGERALAGGHGAMIGAEAAASPEPICHVHHLDLITDPLATVERSTGISA